MTKKIYLDYQATTPVDPEILKKMMPYFTENFGNPHSNNHQYGKTANDAVEDARKAVADLINAEKEEIIFTSGATESNNFAIKSIAKNYFDKDFQIITAKIEHKCVLESCHSLEQEKFEVHYLGVNDDGLINLNKLEALLKNKPALVSIMHVNNEIGVIQPLEEIGKLCEKYNSVFHSDVAQSLGCLEVDVKKFNLKALSISAHKIYGPKGVGALYISNDIKNTLKPLVSGGGQEMGLRSGTLSPALCVGLGEACKDLKKNRSQYFEHYKKLKSYILSELIKSKIDFVINGSVEKRSPVNLNICITGKIAEQLFTFFPHIALSTGAACTSGTIERSHVLSALKISDEQIDGSFRISFGRQSSTNHIKELLDCLKKIK
jgi:cysteine desulfurase